MSPRTLQLRRSRNVAARQGLEADLSITDWNQTCADMDSRCAYCGTIVSGGASIDHFLPMAHGGGTTITNCVLRCLFCNQRKGSRRPEIFFSHDPEKLARLQYDLSHRQPRQGDHPFWSLLIPKEEHPMNREEMQSTPHRLTSGAELHVYDDEQHTVLQFRQPPLSQADPLASSFHVSTSLTPSECIMLARTLLLYASSKIEDKQLSAEPSFSWDLQSLHSPGKGAPYSSL